MIAIRRGIARLGRDYSVGAGEGNRTLMTSLEDRGCEIGVLADQAMPLIPGS